MDVRLKIFLIFILIATTAAQVPAEAHYWWEKVPGFFALFGFLGCLAIIFGAKYLGKLLVKRYPDYYGEEDNA